MRTGTKPILLLDFDGVCHSYPAFPGWEGAATISGPPVPGLFDFLEQASAQFEIHVFSSRTAQLGGLEAMRDWFSRWSEKEGVPLVDLEFPLRKPPAFVTLDDRAIQFRGVWPDVDELRAFKPWNR